MAVTWDQSNDGNNLVYTNGDLTVGITVDADWEQTLATLARSTGKYYFEVETVSNPGIAANTTVGVQNGSESLNSYIGDSTNGWGYQSNGRYYNSLANTGNPTWSTGGTVMVAVDLDNNKIWFGLNGTWDGDPAAGTGEAYSNLSTGDIYPAASPYHSYHTCTAHFVESDMSYSIPTGFSAWEEQITYDNSITFKIDGSKIDSNLTDFPVRIYLTPSGSGGIDWSDVFVDLDTNNKKISIQDSDSNEHYAEISYWSPSTSASIIDFKVPTLSAGIDTEFTFYYDSTVADNTSYIGNTGDVAAQNVWDSNYKGVYHLVSDPTSGITDSTSNSWDMDNYNSNLDSSNLIDLDIALKGIDFNGTNEGLLYNNVSSIFTGYPWSIECFGKTKSGFSTSTGNKSAPFATAAQITTQTDLTSVRCFEGGAQSTRLNSPSSQTTTPVYSLLENTEVYIAGTFVSNTEMNNYSDGLPNGTQGSSQSAPTVTALGIGLQADSSPGYFEGKMSEVRYSDIERTADWIKTTSNSLRNTLLNSVTTDIDITIDTDLQTLTATQLGLSTSVSVVQDLNVLNQTLTQYGSTVSFVTNADVPLDVLSQTVTQFGSTVDLISNANISLDVLNRSLTQLNASITTSYTAELNSLELTVEPETPMVCIGSTIDLNTLTLTKTQPSATLVIDPDVFINLNTLQQQLIINSVTLGIINKIIFPITNGLDDESGTSITNGLERSHNPNTFTGGLTRTSNPTTFTKGLELVKRE